MGSKKRRAKGEGHFYQRRGRYFIQLRTIDANGKRCRKSLAGGISLSSASKVLADYRAQGFICGDATQSLGQWFNAWLERSKKSRADKTAMRYRLLFNKHVHPHLGNKRLIDLKTVMFSSLYSRLSIAPRSINLIHSILNAAINQAIKDEIIHRNVLHGAKKPATRKKQHRIFSELEAKEFCKAIVESRYRFNFLFMLGAGLRIGEALAVGWNAIDLKEKTIRVFRQVTEEDTTTGTITHITQLKTERSNRVVPLPDEIINDLKKTPSSARNGFVFRGKSKSPRSMRREFKMITERMGVKGMTPHDLRHTFASWMLLHGVDLPRVSVLLGHSNTKITGDIYSHVIPGSRDQAREVMTKLFSIAEVENHD